ncbi:nucleotidyltransferase family protein [Cyanobium sp. CH-040]|uniref:nucleotidyltransferase family protein n=1 Tax=Cyanobium sp. CH-040 TaxID=2823708 RepID=UPI0020CD99CF|nr:nucleotidyltransferase domain-containing protein [Cyanobium sp. CH-040]MCP9926366.1 nucleotidyltransferase domain-containing protein [Cyanobium sp. CH-040]
MATATLPWTRPQPLPARVDLGPGLEPEALTAGVRALVAFGSRARGDAHSESDLDLAVICAERLAGSRWHVMGDVAREGRVLYVTG